MKSIHDNCFDFLDKAVRKGRAFYVCSVCGEDVSIAWFYYMQAILDLENPTKKDI
jgi:hypothetical protein